jgi:hypothetical protein
MKWERPEFVEIDMSAEIGGYQRDNDGPSEDWPSAPVGRVAEVAVSGDRA